MDLKLCLHSVRSSVLLRFTIRANSLASFSLSLKCSEFKLSEIISVKLSGQLVAIYFNCASPIVELFQHSDHGWAGEHKRLTLAFELRPLIAQNCLLGDSKCSR